MLSQGNAQVSLAGWFTSAVCTQKKAFWNVLNNYQQKLRAKDQRAQDFYQHGWKIILLWILPSVSLVFHFNSKEETGNLGLTCLKWTLNPPDILCFHLLRFWSLKRLKSVWTKLFFQLCGWLQFLATNSVQIRNKEVPKCQTQGAEDGFGTFVNLDPRLYTRPQGTRKDFVLEINIEKISGITRVQKQNSKCPFPLYIPPLQSFALKLNSTRV